jgi:hypothetical protein
MAPGTWGRCRRPAPHCWPTEPRPGSGRPAQFRAGRRLLTGHRGCAYRPAAGKPATPAHASGPRPGPRCICGRPGSAARRPAGTHTRRALERHLDPYSQLPPPGRRRGLSPVALGIAAGAGHAQQPAHPGDLVVGLLRAGHRTPFGHGCVRAKKAAAFSGARSPSAAVLPRLEFIHARTLHRRQGPLRFRVLPPPSVHRVPKVPSWIPRSRATSAIGSLVEITICTASALNCGLRTWSPAQ